MFHLKRRVYRLVLTALPNSVTKPPIFMGFRASIHKVTGFDENWNVLMIAGSPLVVTALYTNWSLPFFSTGWPAPERVYSGRDQEAKHNVCTE